MDYLFSFWKNIKAKFLALIENVESVEKVENVEKIKENIKETNMQKYMNKINKNIGFNIPKKNYKTPSTIKQLLSPH